jgi:hypothetical protein
LSCFIRTNNWWAKFCSIRIENWWIKYSLWLKVNNDDSLQFKWWDHSQYKLRIFNRKMVG